MGLSLLLIDDDKVTLHIYQLFFEKTNYPGPIFQALNCKLAYNIIKANAHTPYLVVLDLATPEMDGWEFLNLVQKLPKSQIFVAIITGSQNVADRQKAETFVEVLEYYERPLTMEVCSRINEYAHALYVH